MTEEDCRLFAAMIFALAGCTSLFVGGLTAAWSLFELRSSPKPAWRIFAIAVGFCTMLAAAPVFGFGCHIRELFVVLSSPVLALVGLGLLCHRSLRLELSATDKKEWQLLGWFAAGSALLAVAVASMTGLVLL